MAIQDGKTVAAALPTLPGVYRFQDGKGRVLYVGKAKNIKVRVSSYFHSKQQSPRIQLMLQAAAAVDAIVTASEAEALLLENNLIKSEKPKYNILFRDDKSYPYLRLSRHAYPQLSFYRGTVRDDAEYFGPFPDSQAVRETIDIMQRVFQLRTCADSTLAVRTRPCLLHAIGRCSAPCTQAIAPPTYAADAAQARHFLQGGVISAERELRQRMERAAATQQFEEAATLRDRLRALAVVRSRHFADNVGDKGAAVHNDADYVGIYVDDSAACVNIIMVRGGRRVGEKRLFPEHAAGSDAEQVATALLKQHYRRHLPEKIFIRPLPAQAQEAAHLHQHLMLRPRAAENARLDAAVANARLALINRSNRKSARQQRVLQLGKRLNLPQLPQRLECFDISHSMGEETIAARVVFADGAPHKRGYRLFRIRQASQGDDTAAIGEAVTRCYRQVGQEAAPLPDVLFIDGGAAQVGAALAAFAQLDLAPPPLFGIAKGARRKPGEETLIAADGEAFQLSRTDAALHLIQAVRDEAHRFAITAHRRRRDKKRATSSALDGIAGIGAQKRRLLMTYFGGLPALRAASAAELLKVDGIGAELAARIYRALH